MHWFALGDAEIMLHPGGSGVSDSHPTLHAAVSNLDVLFNRITQQGFKPFDHQAPGKALDAPVVRPWGDREFELADPDGQIWAFTEV